MLRVRFGYPLKLSAKGSEILHDLVCSELDKAGEASAKSLSDCLSMVLQKLRENHVISWVKVS